MKAFMESKGVTEISSCDMQELKKLLLYHIVSGRYSSYGELDVEPRFVITMLSGEEGLMTMNVWKNPWQAAVGKIVINQTGSNSKAHQCKSVTTNIMPTNGVMHIFEDYSYYKK